MDVLPPHLVQAKIDPYLDLSSVWNINVDALLEANFFCQTDYSQNLFGIWGGTGVSSRRYLYTARFLVQDSVHVVNELFTSLCCRGIGTWYGNIVICAHEPDTGEILTIGWDKTHRKFTWNHKFEKECQRRARDLMMNNVPEARHLVTWYA